VKYTGTMNGLIAKNEGLITTYQLILAAEHVPTSEALAKLPGMKSVTPPLPNEARYTLTFDRAQLSLNTVLHSVLAAGGQIVSCTEDVKALNQAFMDLTEPGVGP
jgi:ABC-2 type transport system ATP-binding protein